MFLLDTSCVAVAPGLWQPPSGLQSNRTATIEVISLWTTRRNTTRCARSGGKLKKSKKRSQKSPDNTYRKPGIRRNLRNEQVVFTVPVSDDPTVAVLGGGLSGIACALTLEKRGIRSTLFDAGVHGVGGRMGTRVIGHRSLTFDHGAQFFTVSNPNFGELVDGWLRNGFVEQWKGTIGVLKSGGHFSPFNSTIPKYIGVKGMRFLADSILSQANMVDVQNASWISKLEPFNGSWHVSSYKKVRGQFDAVAVAHSGKDAKTLLTRSGLPRLARQMKRLELSSIWAYMAEFKNPLPAPGGTGEFPFQGAFVEGVSSLSWMANNTLKLSSLGKDSPHCWTFLSSAAFGRRNKAQQENIPNARARNVIVGMLKGVEMALGLPIGSLEKPIYTRIQLWGRGLPRNTVGRPCIFDPHARVGLCGDWLMGSGMEAAALSGIALANRIADCMECRKGCDPDEFAIGLDDDFEPVHGRDIGQFPGFSLESLRNSESLPSSLLV